MYNEGNEVKNTVVPVFRYKFSESFMCELHTFSKLHQFEDRIVFKESWLQWIEDNRYMIEMEIRQMQQNGYTGDVMTKMFKSARYYFRNKNVVERKYVVVVENKTVSESEDVIERKYVKRKKDRTVLEAMDRHIREHPTLKPSVSFALFCSSYPFEDIPREKLKKIFQNRDFVCLRKKKPI